MKQYEPFVLHIWDAIASIEKFTRDLDKSEFMGDEKTQLAVVKLFEIIGEATTHLEDEFKSQLDDIDWQKIKDFRNKLVHDYWEIDLDFIWIVIHKNVPILKEVLAPVVETIDRNQVIEDWD